jgi:two-component system, LytTR family, response regulator
MLHAVIAVNERSIRQAIMQTLSSDPSIQTIKECADGASARHAMAIEKPDMLFVDVELPDISGFDVVRASGSIPAVVFLGNMGHHAAQAFEFRAIDYLVKPFSQERLLEALRRAKEAIESGAADHLTRSVRVPRASESSTHKQPVACLERITLKSGNSHLVQKIQSIPCFTAAANYVTVHFNGKEFRVRVSIGSLEKQLDPRQFVRIHRCAIINLEFLKEFRLRGRGGYLVSMMDGKELHMSRRYTARFLASLSSLKYRMQ